MTVIATKLITSPMPTFMSGKGMKRLQRKQIKPVTPPHASADFPSLVAIFAMATAETTMRIQLSIRFAF
jgi:hypothetical protein